MTRRLAGVLVVVAGLFALGAASAGAEELQGPQISAISLDVRQKGISLLSIDPDGLQSGALFTRGLHEEPLPVPEAGAVWSPNGTTLALEAGVGQKRTPDGTELRTKLFLVDADGGNLRPIPGTQEGGDPVFSPDGRTLAFARTKEVRKPNNRGGEETRYQSSSTWTVDLPGGVPRQLTPWKNELSVAPSSFSPDGNMLAVTRVTGSNEGEAVAISMVGGPSVVLAHHALEPTYSPDGSKIAYLSERRFSMHERDGSKVTGTVTDVRVMSSGGSGSVRLTNTPKQAELGLSWSPSGSRLAFTRMPSPETEASFFGFGSAIVEMNADGSCERTVFSRASAVTVGASWRPGPGRDPGPISC